MMTSWKHVIKVRNQSRRSPPLGVLQGPPHRPGPLPSQRWWSPQWRGPSSWQRSLPAPHLVETRWQEVMVQWCCCRTNQKLLTSWNQQLPTWTVGPGLLGVEFGSQRSTRLQFGFGKLGQVGHDRVLVYVGVHYLLRCDDLEEPSGDNQRLIET